MNKIEFLGNLTEQLRNLPKAEVEKLTSFYDEMIQDRLEDGMSEEEAIERIGSVVDAAEAAMQDVSLPSLMKASVKKSREKSSSKTLWLILVILGFPVWFPLLLTFFAVVFVVYLTLWILIVTLYVMELSFAVICVSGIVFGSIYMFIHSISTGICILGLSFALGGVAIACFEPANFLAKQLMKGMVFFIKKVKSPFITKEVAV